MPTTIHLDQAGTYPPADLEGYTQVVSTGTTAWIFRDPLTGLELTVQGSGFAASGTLAEFLAQPLAPVTGFSVIRPATPLAGPAPIFSVTGLASNVGIFGAGYDATDPNGWSLLESVAVGKAPGPLLVDASGVTSSALPGGLGVRFDAGLEDFGGGAFTPDFSMAGSALPDVLRGAAGDDTILGGAGNDNLRGGDGNDSLDGGAGRDRVSGGSGNDTIATGGPDVLGEALQGGGGFDLLLLTTGDVQLNLASVTGIEALSITTGYTRLSLATFAALDELTITAAGAELQAAENDAGTWALGGLDIAADPSVTTLRFLGSRGNDVIAGIGVAALAPGTPVALLNDSIFGNRGNDTVLGDVGNDTVFGGFDQDWLYGEDGNDSLSGEFDFDNLFGGAGDDTLDGGAEFDQMYGGTGNDLYYVDDPDELFFVLVIEDPSAGNDTISASLSWTLGDNFEALVLTGAATAGTGNALGNTITGNELDNALAGLDGADSLLGGLGADTLLGGTGGDTLLGQDGADSLAGEDGDDSLDGGTGADTLSGGAGQDRFVVDNVGDTVTDLLIGGGTDTVFATIAYVLPSLIENLTVQGSAGLAGTGNTAANAITGNNGANALGGLDGDDTLSGLAGNDTLTGGLGTDQLTGGTGNDRFVYAALAESNGALATLADQITDFQADGRDRIDVSAIDASATLLGNNAFTWLGVVGAFTGEGQIRAVSAGPGAFTLLFNTESNLATAEMAIRVQVAAGTLDQADFIA